VENGPVFIALPLYNSDPTFWKSNNDLAHDFHPVSIKGYDSKGFFFRNSWGTDWGNNGCGYLPFIDWRTSVAGSVVSSTKETELEKERPRYVKLLQCIKGYIIKPK